MGSMEEPYSPYHERLKYKAEHPEPSEATAAYNRQLDRKREAFLAEANMPNAMNDPLWPAPYLRETR